MRHLLKILILTFLIFNTSGCDLDILNKDNNGLPEEETNTENPELIINSISIGNQVWMAQNLNLGQMIQSGEFPSNNGQIEKYCYNNDTALCSIYGGLYTWDELMNYKTQEGIRGICPEGWHIPSLTDWQILIDHLGGENEAGGRLKEPGNDHWEQPNYILNQLYEFLARPGGIYITSSYPHFQGLKTTGSFATSSGSAESAWSIILVNSGTSITTIGSPVNVGLSIRCVKN